MNTTAKPQWIERMYAATTGRDHLGLGRVSSDQNQMNLTLTGCRAARRR